MMLPSLSYAQLKKTGEINTETICSFRMGNMNLQQSAGRYFLSMGTTNQFDDMMLLMLGRDKESAGKTLVDLIGLCSSIKKGSLISVDNGLGGQLRISKGAFKNEIWIEADGYAGYVATSKMELRKVYDRLMGKEKENYFGWEKQKK